MTSAMLEYQQESLKTSISMKKFDDVNQAVVDRAFNLSQASSHDWKPMISSKPLQFIERRYVKIIDGDDFHVPKSKKCFVFIYSIRYFQTFT